MFLKRENGTGIFFTRAYKPGAVKLVDEVCDGDSVILKVDEESVLVKGVQEIDAAIFRGIIYGFEPSVGIEYKGFKIDQGIKFSEDNVFSCGDGA